MYSPAQNSQLSFSEKSVTFFASLVIFFLLPTSLGTYGIYILYLNKEGISPNVSLWTPTVFIAVFYISKPWFKEWAEEWIESGGNEGKWRTVSGVFIAAVGVSGSAILPSYFTKSLWYAVLAALGTSMAMIHTQILLTDTFPSRPRMVTALCWVAKATGQCVGVVVVRALADSLGVKTTSSLITTPFFHGGLLLLALPATLLWKRRIPDGPTVTSRYSDFQRPTGLFKEDEMNVFSFSQMYLEDSSVENLPSQELTTFRNWKSPSDSEQLDSKYLPNDEIEYNNIEMPSLSDEFETFMYETSPLSRRRNSSGVEILPEIIEENEITSCSEEENEIFEDDDEKRKRFSKNVDKIMLMGEKLEQVISNNDQKEMLSTIDQNTKDEVVLQIIDQDDHFGDLSQKNKSTNQTDGSTTKKWNNSSCCSCCSPYLRIKLKTRTYLWYEGVTTIFVTPFVRSIKLLSFYPSLLLKFTNALHLLLFTALIPVAVYTTIENKDFDTSYLLTYAAFSWICFLVMTPWFTDLSKNVLKYFYMLSSAVCTCGFILLVSANIHNGYNTVVVSCIICGFGYGASTYLGDIVVKEALGVQHYSKVAGTLDTLTGILIIIFVLCTNFLYELNELREYFIFLIIIHSFSTIGWIVEHWVRVLSKENNIVSAPVYTNYE